MTDDPHVRITCGSYDFAHPREKQTQVYVRIPCVCTASYLLDADLYDDLKDMEWGDALNTAHDAWVQRGWVSDTSSASERKALRDWLVVDENWDELREAWLQHQARSNPVSLKLMRDVERLKAGSSYGQTKEEECIQEPQKLWTDLLNAMNALKVAGEDPRLGGGDRIAGEHGVIKWCHATGGWQLTITGD